MCFYRIGRFSGRRDRLTPHLVQRVQANDPEATLELLDIFDERIRHYSTVELYDRYGNPVRVCNMEYAAQLEDKLVQAFKQLGLPDINNNGRKVCDPRNGDKHKKHSRKGKHKGCRNFNHKR